MRSGRSRASVAGPLLLVLALVVLTSCGGPDRTVGEAVAAAQATVNEVLEEIAPGSSWDLDEYMDYWPCDYHEDLTAYSLTVPLDDVDYDLPEDLLESLRSFWLDKGVEPDVYGGYNSYGRGFEFTVLYEGIGYSFYSSTVEDRRLLLIGTAGCALPDTPQG